MLGTHAIGLVRDAFEDDRGLHRRAIAAGRRFLHRAGRADQRERNDKRTKS